MKKILALLVLAATLSGCDLRNFGSVPFYWDLTPPDGPPEYRQGWADGCESARDANIDHFNKALLTVKQDADLMKNPVYDRVWHDAFNYCWQMQETILSNKL